MAANIWKIANISFNYTVRGPVSWAAPLCAVIVLEAIIAAFIATLVLTAAATDGARVAAAGAFGGVVLLAGLGVLILLLRRRR